MTIAKHVLLGIVVACLLLAGYELRDDIKHEAMRLLVRLGICYADQRGDVDYYYLSISPRILYAALFLALALVLALWPVIAGIR